MVRDRAAALATAILLLGASPALATTRYTAPSGSATDLTCAQAAPCSLQHAVEHVAEPGDEVIVTPGRYVVGVMRVDKPLDIHGEDGHPHPVVTTADQLFGPLTLNRWTHDTPGADGSIVRHLRLEWDSDSRFPALLSAAKVTFEDLIVVRAGGGIAVQLAAGTLMRDSVVSASGDTVRAVSVVYPGYSDFQSISAKLRNVTASATGPGSVGLEVMARHEAEMDLCQQPDDATVSLVNSIVRGESDIRIGRDGGCDPNSATAIFSLGN